MSAHIAAAVACVAASGLAVLLWARTVDLYDAVVPDWVKMLARQQCVDGSSIGKAQAPTAGLSSARMATGEVTESVAKVLPDLAAVENVNQVIRGHHHDNLAPNLTNHQIVSDSPRSWRTQSNQRRPKQEHEEEQQPEVVRKNS